MCSKYSKKNEYDPSYWNSMMNKYEGRKCQLEEKECELKSHFDILGKTAPQMVLLNMDKLMDGDCSFDAMNQLQGSHKFRSYRNQSSDRSLNQSMDRNRYYFCKDDDKRNRSRSPIKLRSCSSSLQSNNNCGSKMVLQQYIRSLEADKEHLITQKRGMENVIKNLEAQLIETKGCCWACRHTAEDISDTTPICSLEIDLMRTVQKLKERGIKMSKRIEILEKREAAYLETLKQADEICAEMEIGYKQHCSAAEQNEAEMRDRLQRLKKREDNVRQGRDHENSASWSIIEPICSMFNKWP